jgi:hypothetical protein
LEHKEAGEADRMGRPTESLYVSINRVSSNILGISLTVVVASLLLKDFFTNTFLQLLIVALCFVGYSLLVYAPTIKFVLLRKWKVFGFVTSLFLATGFLMTSLSWMPFWSLDSNFLYIKEMVFWTLTSVLMIFLGLYGARLLLSRTFRTKAAHTVKWSRVAVASFTVFVGYFFLWFMVFVATVDENGHLVATTPYYGDILGVISWVIVSVIVFEIFVRVLQLTKTTNYSGCIKEQEE